MITIYFVRHGETDYNKRGIIQGSGIDSSLNETGRAQAAAFFSKYHDQVFDAIWGSDLQRTHQTLKGWYDEGCDIGRAPGLNEVNWGVHEGKVPSPGQREAFLHTVRHWRDGDLSAKVEGGESPVEAWARAADFFEQVREQRQGQTLLMCSHGRQLRVLLSMLIDEDLRKMENYSHQNTGLTIIHLPPHGPAKLVLTNDLSHWEEEVKS